MVPGGVAAVNNSDYNYDEITLQDASGAVPWSEFIGGTVLRTLFAYELSPSTVFAATIATGYSTDNFGIFMTADTQPVESIWSPNVPSGDFMMRWTTAFRKVVDQANDVNNEYWACGPVPYSAGPANEVDIGVRRRIRENFSMFMSWKHFEDATVVTQMAIGYTGRVLIQLP